MIDIAMLDKKKHYNRGSYYNRFTHNSLFTLWFNTREYLLAFKNTYKKGLSNIDQDDFAETIINSLEYNIEHKNSKAKKPKEMDIKFKIKAINNLILLAVILD